MTVECATCHRETSAIATKAGICITCHFNIGLGQTRRANRLEALLKEARATLLEPPALPGEMPADERSLLDRIDAALTP